jgi:hypothetical protein
MDGTCRAEEMEANQQKRIVFLRLDFKEYFKFIFDEKRALFAYKESMLDEFSI